MKRDLDFVAGNFLETPIPKDKQFLLKYFKSKREVTFLRYFLVFGDSTCFAEHTGLPCRKDKLQHYEKKLLRLLAARQEAKGKFDIDLLWKIENGKYK